MVNKLTLADKTVAPGSYEIVRIHVTTDLGGGEVNLWVHVLHGAEPGPCLTLTSMLHGSEFFSLDVIKEVIGRVDVAKLRGTILAVPVANPVAFERGTRNTPDESDAADLNRIFPGTHTFIAEQLARVITDKLLTRTDYLLDFHQGGWGSMMGTVGYGVDYSKAETIEQSKQMAHAFGYPSVRQMRVVTGFPGPKAATSYAGEELGVPNIVVEIGGCGFDPELERTWLDSSVGGVMNILRHLNMIPGEPELPDRYLLYANMVRVNPRIGGYLVPSTSPDAVLTEVKKGQKLGVVISPYTFEVLEELISPCNGAVIMNARPYPVRPGDWAFGVANLDDGIGRWITVQEGGMDAAIEA